MRPACEVHGQLHKMRGTPTRLPATSGMVSVGSDRAGHIDRVFRFQVLSAGKAGQRNDSKGAGPNRAARYQSRCAIYARAASFWADVTHR
jgi:hypothetical protein